MASEKRMRRSPQQARGQRRVTIILDAAAQIFAEVGYEEATTNAIAIRANTSIGSLYQFFPNKLAILNALAHRYHSHLNGFLDDVFKGDSNTLQDQLSRLIDGLSDYYINHPAFQPMLYASQSSRALTHVAAETGDILVRRVSTLFMEAVPELSREQSDFYATVIVFMFRSLIPLSQNSSEAYRGLILPQLKRMTFAYLATLDAFAALTFSFSE